MHPEDLGKKRDAFSEILTLTREKIKAHRDVFVITGLILWTLTTIVSFHFEQYLLGSGLVQMMESDFTGQSLQEFFTIIRTLPQVPLSMSLVTLLVVCIYIIAHIFILRVTFETPSTEKEYINLLWQSPRQFRSYLGTDLLQGIFLFFLFLLFIIPGVIYSIFRLFSLIIVVKERIRFRVALQASYQIVKGRRRRTLFIFLCLTVLLILVEAGTTALAAGGEYLFNSPLVYEAIDGITGLILQLFRRVAMACFYLYRKQTAPQESSPAQHAYHTTYHQ